MKNFLTVYRVNVKVSFVINRLTINGLVPTYEKNQWTNTASVILWSKSWLPTKKPRKFFKFDHWKFYSSISENLLENAPDFVTHDIKISEKIILIIWHYRKPLLFCLAKVWVKKSNPEFDMTMYSFDGTVICKLIGLYLLDQLSNMLSVESFCLHHDDNLAILSGICGPDTKWIIKNIRNLFKTNNLKITIEAGMQQTDFLDVTFNVSFNGKYWPNKKNELTTAVHPHPFKPFFQHH